MYDDSKAFPSHTEYWVKLQSFTTMYARGVLQISSDEDDRIRAKIKTQNNP